MRFFNWPPKIPLGELEFPLISPQAQEGYKKGV